jgi:TetR/AcrR family transcriptional regulator
MVYTILMRTQQAGFSTTFEHSDELFEAALAEFIDKGYEQASINTILQAAGMSKGQFYYHFKTKEDLYLSLIGVLIERKQAFLATVMQPQDFQQDIFGIFLAQVRYGMAFAREYPSINRFGESFLREKGGPIYDKALATYNFEDNAAIDRLIDMAHQRSELRDDLPLPFIKKIIGYLFTHAADITELRDPAAFEDEMGYLIAFIKSGLGK